jgi:ribosomal protein L37E
MKNWRAYLCFLVGHKINEPTTGVEACERCGEAREWFQPPWSRREAEGVMVYPWTTLKAFILEHFRRLKTHLFCHQCGNVIFHRVDKHFCSKKCEDQWLPF